MLYVVFQRMREAKWFNRKKPHAEARDSAHP
jgi:hypothetical protein